MSFKLFNDKIYIMYITYSKVVGLNIYDLKSSACLGEVDDVVIDDESLKIAAFVLKKQSFWDKKVFAIVEADILEISKLGIVVNDENAIVDLDELVRVRNKISDGYVGIGQNVLTTNGKYIGKAFDFIFDNKSFEILKFYSKNILEEKIISRKLITSFCKRTIIIKNDRQSSGLKNPAAETSEA